MNEEEQPIKTIEDLYNRLSRYVSWLAYTKSSDNVLMQSDELEGELLAEMVYGFQYYKDQDLGDSDLLYVIKRMLDNRIGELIHRFYGTHRQAESTMDDYDELVSKPSDAAPDPERYVEHTELLCEFIESLTVDEQELVAVLLSQDERIAKRIRLVAVRKTFVFKEPHISINADLVADALHKDRQEVRAIWCSVRRKWWIYEETL